ncbi:MAG: hypothetical protein WAN77_05540 [Thermoplasmata archaeon]
MVARRAEVRKSGEPPAAFRISRNLPPGRHPLLSAFPGLDRLPPARRLEPDPKKRKKLFEESCVELVEGDVWMYVAPFEIPTALRRRRRGWNPVVSPDSDCIVIGVAHLRESPAMMLFMDIYHELCHVRQRQSGANLFDGKVSYVQRWTEVEAYRFVVLEARRLGVSNEFLRDYLRVEWISDSEHRELLTNLEVPLN